MAMMERMIEQPNTQVSPTGAGASATMKVQKFQWGALRWISEAAPAQGARAMLVARALFQPGGVQQAHYHLDEQVLYVERGHAVCQLDGRSLEVGPGDLFHAPAFCWHSVCNRDDAELVLLVTYREVDPSVILNLEPVRGEMPPLLSTHAHLETTLARLSERLFTMEDLRCLLKTVGAEMLVVDPSGLVDRPERLPAFCRLVRSTPDGSRMCRTTLAQLSCNQAQDLAHGQHDHDRARAQARAGNRTAVAHSACCEAYAGMCWAGLTFVAVPLGLPGVQGGTVLVTGMRLSSPDEPGVLQNLCALESRLGFPRGHLIIPYSAVPQVSKNYLYAIMRLLLGVVRAMKERPAGPEQVYTSMSMSMSMGESTNKSAAGASSHHDGVHTSWSPWGPDGAIDAGASAGRPDATLLDGTLESACAYVREMCHRPLRLGDVAHHVFMNPCYLSRKFKQALGISFSEYLHVARVERAVARLQAEPGTPLKDLASSLGFSSPSHFTRVFKKITGLTPTQYRRANCR